MMNTSAPTTDEPIRYTRKNPYVAHLKAARLLTTAESEKDTRHYEIDLSGSRMHFEPGDSLAVLPTNCPAVVDDLLKVLHLSGEEMVTDPENEEVPLRQALIHSYTVTQPDNKFLKTIISKANDASILEALLDPAKRKELSDYLWGKEIIDILLEYPEVKFEAQEFVSILKKLQPRLYSIASSLKANPEQVHLTVATVTYHSHGRLRKGVCSTFLAERIDQSTPLPTFITPGKGFRLPDPSEDTPIIMCGPGTGIAPFRAFLQERRATNAKGEAWLLFGDQHEASDFLYREELEKDLADSVLHKLTTAFSRDQDYKIYVQHRMMENSKLFYEWLENGAIFYVCGDAARMAPDVDKALHEIIEKEGGKSAEEAVEYVEAMKKDKRYRRDVY